MSENVHKTLRRCEIHQPIALAYAKKSIILDETNKWRILTYFKNVCSLLYILAV